jgi:hypothetical protein
VAAKDSLSSGFYVSRAKV